MKKPVLLLTSVLISTSIIASSPTLAAENSSSVKPYNHSEVIKKEFPNLPKELLDANNDRNVEIENKGKDYLSTSEVTNINPQKLSDIYQELKSEIESGKYTDEQLNQLVTEKIKSNVSIIKKDTQTLRAAAEDPYVDVPGLGKLSTAEINLAKKNPIEFIQYTDSAVAAKAYAEGYYTDKTLHQGNGDAFRHTYWNAIMVKNFGAVKGPEHGYNRAKAWADAHETMSSGIDKQMDLMNNETGRYMGWEYFSSNISTIRNAIVVMVSQGSLVRIVNNKLVATNSTK